MKKRQERNNTEFGNTEASKNKKMNRRDRKNLNKSVNQNKTKRINSKNLPTFILIGLIIMLIIIAIIYYVFLRYAPEMIITYSGYAVEGKTMVENLKNSDVSNVNPYLGLIEVHENDLLYKRLNSYYIGEDDKKEIDINYPIYINDGNSLLNIGKNTKLITVNYEEVEGYPEFMMTDGVMYNGADLTRADGNKYIFLKSEDEIFTNVGKIKITTASNTYEIKEYSNIYFTENYITYYEMEEDSDVQNWYMKYKRINDIDNNSKIEVNGETITYKTFLERLGLINTEENNNTNNEAQTNEIAENTIKEETEQEQTTEENTIDTTDGNKNNNDEDEWQEGMWEKPTVSCTDFEGDVYTIRTNLSVTDRAGVITRGVIFEISLNGRLNRRVQATQTGILEITNLQPYSEYEIRGIFYYNDENGVEQEEEFYTGKVTTKSIDTLGTIDFSFQNGTIYSNKIELIHLKLNNDLNEEVIRGISRLQVEIGDAAYRLTNDQIDELKSGKEITYQTSENLTSNSKIKYKITAFDRFGNELKEKNNTGETITSKQAPSANIRVTKQDVTEVDLEISLTNKDNVKLENYRYEITNQGGDVVKQGNLNKNSDKETLLFNDLDPNGYYQITIYGDYDIENGEEVHTNSEIGKASFVTRPLASLGYMQVKIDDKEVTQDSMNLGISIDTVQTDARLVAILNKVEIVIYDQGKNIEYEEEEKPEETEIKRITLTDEEAEKLKIAEEVELKLDQLNSNTIYKIDVIATVKQGSVEQVVEDKQNLDQVITLKMPAEVQIRNQFVIGTMIDLDMRIEDPDGAVLVDKVRIEVRDKDNKLVDLSEMPTNADYERKTYEDLTPNEEYRIIVYAPQYNEGSTDAAYKADYILTEIKIVTETGISGKLDLIGLEKTPTGKNLIDVSSKVNWYEKCFNTTYKYGISYNENTKILTLGGTSSYNRLNYYDLSKYLGQEITISFKAKTQDNAIIQIIEKSNDDFNNLNRETYYTINNLKTDWQEYSYTVTLSKTGYIGFGLNNDNTSVEIQDLQVELGSKKTDYEEFKYDYNANVEITVNDARDEIITNDYYIRIYKNEEKIQEIRYEELEEDNKVEDVQKTYNIESGANYKIELLVKIADRYYELDSQKFITEGTKELKGILNENDFLKIQPYGDYIILTDIDLSGKSSSLYRFGYTNLQFNGRIDFYGNTLIRDVSGGTQQFYAIGKDGVIENLVFDLKINNKNASSFNGFVSLNYGTIRNIQINVLESTINENHDAHMFTGRNYGVIENFVVNLKKPYYFYDVGDLIGYANYGTIKNGYVYGENIKVLNKSANSSQASVIVNHNMLNGVIENIFTLVNVDNVYSDASRQKGNISVSNQNNATVQNVYSVGVGENTNLTYGPNVYQKNSKKIYNNYYFADKIFTSELEMKGNALSLWDAEFQNHLINGDGAFIVDDLVNEGYYPQLNMPDVMPTQDYIALPEVEDADLPDILSTKVLEQGTDRVKVQFSVNNPSAEQISDIDIQNLDVEILSQEYSNGKSTVISELKNPVICVSSYDVQSITTKGAFGSSYTRPYDPGERVINVDLYKEIWNVNDWKAINDSPTENYMLMDNLDFINEDNTVNITNVRGIINGNGHSLSNINLTGSAVLVNHLYGTFENIFINNFNQEGTTYGGLIARAENGSTVINVHATNVNITKSGGYNIGALIDYAYASSIKNCSASDVQLKNLGIQSSIYIGGIAGYVDSTSIENSYAQGIEITDEKAVSSGIGGILGSSAGTISIKNCYAEGKIISNNLNVGGIVGNISSANVENCYSKVNISTTNNNVGGIVGIYSGTDMSTISNNLTVGNIYTTSGLNSLNRIVGNNSDTSSNNYAYEKQLLNGYESEGAKGATLLSTEEILNLNLGDNYNYDGKTEGILPKLYNAEGTELLPNQIDILIDNNASEGAVKLEVESIEATKPNTTEAEVSVRINNPAEVEITGIEIEDMTIASITRNVTQNGITNITVRATPNRYYDSYKLTGIKYKTEDEKEQTKEVENEIQVQFYKEIYTYEDWQSIEADTYQNYRLMADIDFTGKNNIKNNINVNRLEAENNLYTLKNIELEFNEQNTGLINNVKTSIKNIGFENITLTNAKGSGSYFGVIASNNGDMENLIFKDIIVNAKGIGYVGTIGGMTSGSVNDIELENITVNGNSRVGGLMGLVNVNEEVINITGDNINVTGTGSYIGGIIGNQEGTNIVINNVYLNNSNVTGVDYVAGIIGIGSYGTFTYFEVENTHVSGGYEVGGIFGQLTSNERTNSRMFLHTNYCEITGSGNNIGGITGYMNGGENEYWSVTDTVINTTSVNSSYIGGLAGGGTWFAITHFQVDNFTINSNGKNVGGALGNSTNRNSLCEGEVSYTTVNGGSNVAGLIGNSSWITMRDLYVDADVIAENNTAGGIIGYMDNTYMTPTVNTIQIYRTMVIDSSVSAPTKAGGLIGDITSEIYRDRSYYYNNYIDADVTSNNTSTGSLLIGGRPDENDYLTRTYVYRYSTLNGNYVYATNDNIDDDQYLIRSDLDTQSTYFNTIGLSTTFWNCDSLQEGKYPKLKDSYLYMPEFQAGVDLPTDPEITSINSLSVGDEIDNNANEVGTNTNNIADENGISTQSVEALPIYKVYPTSVDEINIDFSDIPKGVSFTYYVNGEEKETVDLSKKTYTFKYNYQDTLEIKLTNGTNEETITINPDDVRSEASLVGANNAYLLGTNLYINGELQQGEYVNVYGGYALNRNGQILDIATKQITSGNAGEAVTTSLEETTKPLHTYNYKENNIEVYGTYSTVNSNAKSQIYNVRNGELSALSNSIDIKIGNSIIDNYNDKEYQTILTSNGELIDLKERLQYPDNFLRSNIRQIVQNTDVESPEMMVLYNTGKVIVFNYVTGNVVYENDEKADEGLVNYLTRSFSNIWSDYEDRGQEYAKSKELEAKLAKLPVEEAMQEISNNSISTNNTNNSSGNSSSENVSSNTNTSITTGNSYITVYNGNTGEYEVYSEDEILNGDDENPVSETEKIKENGLEGVYGYDAKEETKPQANGAIIVVAIIAVAIIALVVLRKVIVKNNSKKEKNN